MTPLEAATGKRPDLSKLHLFGCLCYPFEQTHKKKFDPRAVPAVFVGYDDMSPAYLIFFPNTGKIQKCRVVTFTDTCYYNSDGERAAAADRDVTLIPPANSDVTHTPALPLASPNSGDSSSRQVQHNTTDGDSTNYSVEPIRNINADQDTHSDISFSSDSDNDVYSETSDGQFLAPQPPPAASPQGVPL